MYEHATEFFEAFISSPVQGAIPIIVSQRHVRAVL
jgi:hypothetical protein